MSPFPFKFRFLFVALVAGMLSVGMSGQSVVQAVNTVDQLVRNYNLISFGNTTFTQYGDTEGPIAVKGNLYLDGGTIAAQPGKYGTMTDPTLYVGGQLTMSNIVNLQSGYASTPALGATYTWDGTQKRLSGGGGVLSTSNTNDPLGSVDPRNNPGPASWNWTTIQSQLTAASQTFSNATATGVISVGNNTLTFSAPNGQTSGVVVFDFNMNLLSGNQYNGQSFSNIGINVPANMNFVINVINAGGRTLFGTGSGINFNNATGYERLLWNIETSNGQDVNIGNGGQFYGSILAPQVNLNNTGGTAITGQVVAASLDYSGAELHYVGFSAAVIPEPSTYGAILLGVGGVVVGFLRWRRQRASGAAR